MQNLEAQLSYAQKDSESKSAQLEESTKNIASLLQENTNLKHEIEPLTKQNQLLQEQLDKKDSEYNNFVKVRK